MQDDVRMGWENQRHRLREASTLRWPRLRFQREVALFLCHIYFQDEQIGRRSLRVVDFILFPQKTKLCL